MFGVFKSVVKIIGNSPCFTYSDVDCVALCSVHGPCFASYTMYVQRVTASHVSLH